MTDAWTIPVIRQALEQKKISARELTKDYLARIALRNKELNAFLALSPDLAFAQADRVDALVAKGAPLPPLAFQAGAAHIVESIRILARGEVERVNDFVSLGGVYLALETTNRDLAQIQGLR